MRIGDKSIDDYNKVRALFLAIAEREPAWRVRQSAYPNGTESEETPYRYLQLQRDCRADESSVPLDEARGLAIANRAYLAMDVHSLGETIFITVALSGAIDPADPVVIAAVTALAAKAEAGRAA